MKRMEKKWREKKETNKSTNRTTASYTVGLTHYTIPKRAYYVCILHRTYVGLIAIWFGNIDLLWHGWISLCATKWLTSIMTTMSWENSMIIRYFFGFFRLCGSFSIMVSPFNLWFFFDCIICSLLIALVELSDFLWLFCMLNEF